MAAPCRKVNYQFVKRSLRCFEPRVIPCRWSNTLRNQIVEKHRHSPLSSTRELVKQQDDPSDVLVPREFRFVHPDFLPYPIWNRRDRVREKLEREDMLKRRAVLDIPEFYVGSIMAVSIADKNAPGKQNRFVGICIDRAGHGLNHYFVLRNAIDGQGVEIKYDMYNPLLQKIEVLKMEKRLDPQLYYLRDAPLEYSTFRLDMEPVPISKGAHVPLNAIKVKLNPRPWSRRWERSNLKGVEPLDDYITEKMKKQKQHPQIQKTWEMHDLMLKARSSIDDREVDQIMNEVYKRKEKIQKEKLQKRGQEGKREGKKAQEVRR
ncbi:hypothetical protein CHS0354_027972 [Potamilus streckersoni]|uniref:Large ribosomal subunit protein bL19m n=1 Tax=Potamilus streckersoni TaxID=2493646 RepID=A0AAE0T5G3_9BIVA|nr:hypothetical protein CHS0354_027972 [Potamilus streckersoni]